MFKNKKSFVYYLEDNDDNILALTKYCEWGNCKKKGEYKAPTSRDKLRDFKWFCLEHVRIYNSSWNYYEGMSVQDFNELVRSDTTWNRPTWPIGDHQVDVMSEKEDNRSGPENIRKSNENFKDPFGFFAKDTNFRGPTEQEVENSLSIEENKALTLLGLDVPVKISELKARYKLLVKECHPDRTGGNKKLEERFKQINEAYQKVMTKLK